jgi:hypothetical protein
MFCCRHVRETDHIVHATDHVRRRRRRAPWSLAILAVAILATATPASAHVTNSFDHLWNDHILPLISTNDGQVNQAADPIDWTKLKSVPRGFADGVDNGLTQVSHSNDLTGSGGRLSPLAIDTNRIQRRVTTACGPGAAINSIGVTGAAACTQGPSVSYTFHDATVDLPGEPATVNLLSMTLPAGQWLILAKGTASGFGTWYVTCWLETDFDFDQSEVMMPWVSSRITFAHISLMVTRSAPAQFVARLRCGEQEGDANMRDVKMAAIRIGPLTPWGQ